VLPLGKGEPPVGEDFRRLATVHMFGDSWPREGFDTRSRALISVAIAATLDTHEPLRGQLRIALKIYPVFTSAGQVGAAAVPILAMGRVFRADSGIVMAQWRMAGGWRMP
jgi:hypothetical protein